MLKIFQMGAEPCHGYVVDGQIADALNHNPVAEVGGFVLKKLA